MKRFKWRWTLIAVSLVVLVSPLSGCAAVAQQVPEQPVSSSGSRNYSTATTSPPSSSLPVINAFSASPETIKLGLSITLNWDVSDATAVTIHPVPGSVGSSGTEQLSPSSTTTYILTATNNAGSSTGTTTVTVTSDDETLIGCDPVTGRNQEVDLTWEQLCLSSQYQVQIAKDAAFTLIVFDSGTFAPYSSLSPALPYPAGGVAPPGAVGSAIAAPAGLEAGHTYYWRARVRLAATGQTIRSPWSMPQSFTIKSGLPASAPSYGSELLSPSNGSVSCPVRPVSFSWTPFKDTIKYRFILARDAALTDVIAQAEVATTAYEYSGKLGYSTNYFWRVMAIEPVPSDWSATCSFQTEAAPAPAEQAPPSAPSPQPAEATPLWAWVIISIGAIMVIAVLVLVFKTRRR